MSDLALSNFELGRILAGARMNCATLTGEQVWVRLATADELMEKNRQALAEMFPDGDGPSPMSRLQAEQLSRPVGSL